MAMTKTGLLALVALVVLVGGVEAKLDATKCLGAADPTAAACCDDKGCVAGRWGSCGCDYKCPEACAASGCDRATGTCAGAASHSDVGVDPLHGTGDMFEHAFKLAKCVHPTGDDCSWYGECLKPGLADECPLIDDLMDRKCREFRDSEGGLSEDGRKWSAYIRACIQQTMGDKLLREHGKHTCAVASKMFFAEHHPCYLKGPVSFCDLPALDQAAIIARASVEVFSRSAVDVTVMGTGLLASCGVEYMELAVDKAGDVGQGLFDELRSLFGLTVAVQKVEGQDKVIVVVRGDHIKDHAVRAAIHTIKHQHSVPPQFLKHDRKTGPARLHNLKYQLHPRAIGPHERVA